MLSPFCDVFCRHRRSKLRKAAPKRSDFDLRRLWQTAALAKASRREGRGSAAPSTHSPLPGTPLFFSNPQLAVATSALAVQATFVLGMSFARFVHLNRHIARTAVHPPLQAPWPTAPLCCPCWCCSLSSARRARRAKCSHY